MQYIFEFLENVLGILEFQSARSIQSVIYNFKVSIRALINKSDATHSKIHLIRALTTPLDQQHRRVCWKSVSTHTIASVSHKRKRVDFMFTLGSHSNSQFFWLTSDVCPLSRLFLLSKKVFVKLHLTRRFLPTAKAGIFSAGRIKTK